MLGSAVPELISFISKQVFSSSSFIIQAGNKEGKYSFFIASILPPLLLHLTQKKYNSPPTKSVESVLLAVLLHVEVGSYVPVATKVSG